MNLKKFVVEVTIEEKVMDSTKFRLSPVQNMGAACVGAVATSFMMTPLDLVKTRLQAQNGLVKDYFLYNNGLMDHLCTTENCPWYQKTSRFNGTWDAFKKIVRYEGVLSLWSGLGPTLVLALPTTVLYFASYEELKSSLTNYYDNNLHQSLWIPFVSASVCRFVIAFISSPLELVRTKMQAQKLSYLEVHRALINLISSRGVPGLWTGGGATLLRDTTFSGFYFLGYETMKLVEPDFKFMFINNFLAGCTAGTAAAVITTPFDVVKTHTQIESAEEIIDGKIKIGLPKRRMFPTLVKIFRESGLKGVFAGVVPRVLKIAPSCAIMITTFEYGKTFFEDQSKNITEIIKGKK